MEKTLEAQTQHCKASLLFKKGLKMLLASRCGKISFHPQSLPIPDWPASSSSSSSSERVAFPATSIKEKAGF